MMFAILLAAVLFTAMLLLLELGHRAGARRVADADAAKGGLSAVDGAVFGLLGLLIAFTFAAAESRLNHRRQQIVQEANAIGTAYLRLDLLPSEARDRLREQFKRYLDERITTYRLVPDLDAAMAALARSTALQGEIWTQATATCRQEPSHACMLLLPALNEMIDITTSRLFAARTHQPPIVFAMLTGVALVSALLAGYGMAGARRGGRWLHMLAYAGVMAMTVYVILDLEFPRIGLIRLDESDQVLIDLRESMK
jgi:hypothetical protein